MNALSKHEEEHVQRRRGVKEHDSSEYFSVFAAEFAMRSYGRNGTETQERGDFQTGGSS